MEEDPRNNNDAEMDGGVSETDPSLSDLSVPEAQKPNVTIFFINIFSFLKCFFKFYFVRVNVRVYSWLFVVF